MNYATQMNKQYILSWLEKLLHTPSPTGYCFNIINMLSQELERLGHNYEISPKGNLIVTVNGTKNSSSLGISGHVDTLGAMVRSITSHGTLKITALGGYAMQTIEGEYCIIHTRNGKTYEGTVLSSKPSVHVYADAREFKRDEKAMEIRIDETVHNKSDVEALGINAGDFISWDARTKILENGWVKSRHLDDKASVSALLGVLEWIKRENITLPQTTKFVFSTYEEVGHGSSHIPSDIEEFLSVDMGCIGDDLTATEHDVSICAKDSSGPYDYNMTTKLIELAKEQQIKFAVDVYPFYGSDTSAALRGGNNIRGALIGPGVHASHGMERTHSEAIFNTAALVAAYMMSK